MKVVEAWQEELNRLEALLKTLDIGSYKYRNTESDIEFCKFRIKEAEGYERRHQEGLA